MEKEAKGSTFKMKAGKEGPMKKNFPSAFKDNGDDPFTPDPKSKNFVAREIKSAESEAELKKLTGQARVDAFSKRHDKKYTYGVNTAGTVEEGRGQNMFVDEKGRSMEMNERSYLAPLKKTDGLKMPPPYRGFNRPKVPSGNISTYDSDKKSKNLETGKRKVDFMHHTTRMRKNPSGKKTEKSRTDYLKSLDK